MYDVKLFDYQIAELVGKYVRYSNRWDLKGWLQDLLHIKSNTPYNLFKKDIENLLGEYIREIQRLQVCGILYGPCNQKMIDKYLWGVDEYGASINPEFVSRFTDIIEKYKKGETCDA